MKSIKSKAFVLALGLFAFSGAFAQDTSKTPKPDTTKTPQPDTTKSVNKPMSMLEYNQSGRADVAFVTMSFLAINDKKLAAKKEAIDEKKIA